MDLDTLVAICGLMVATNAPLYLLTLNNYRMLSWIRSYCWRCGGNRQKREIPSIEQDYE